MKPSPTAEETRLTDRRAEARGSRPDHCEVVGSISGGVQLKSSSRPIIRASSASAGFLSTSLPCQMATGASDDFVPNLSSKASASGSSPSSIPLCSGHPQELDLLPIVSWLDAPPARPARHSPPRPAHLRRGWGRMPQSGPNGQPMSRHASQTLWRGLCMASPYS
jgi:hypothetical protein